MTSQTFGEAFERVKQLVAIFSESAIWLPAIAVQQGVLFEDNAVVDTIEHDRGSV